MSHTLLIVDDEAGLSGCYFETAITGLADFEVLTATGVSEALAICRRRPNIDVVLLDICFDGAAAGMDVLPELRSILPDAEIIVFTKLQNPPIFPAMKRGATKLLSKHDYSAEEITHKITESLARIGRRKRIREEALKLAEAVGAVFVSEAMIRVFSEAFEARSHTASVLITGPTGVGKELVARAIGKIPGLPFVAHSCANIEDTLIESTLFGHERGAFTDAKSRHAGLFEQASGGNLFLDEVGTLSKKVQEKLLRAIETQEITPLGAAAPIKVNVRLICATNEDLKARIASGDFREDLYQRLAGRHIVVPALCERREDIAPLIHAFIKRLGSAGMRMDRGCISLFERQSWPRNVRQLLDTVSYMVAHSGGFDLDSADVPYSTLVEEVGEAAHSHVSAVDHFIFKAPWDEKLADITKSFERAYIEATRRRLGRGATMRHLARTLKIAETTFKRRLKEHNMVDLAALFGPDDEE